MPDFAYIAKTTSGQRHEGVIEAGSRRDAMQRLRQRKLFPVNITEAAAAGGAGLNLQLPSRVKKEQIADLCTQLADLLNNGVPMLESLSILADVSVHPRLQAAMQRIHDAVAE